jgi:hypothetical protein
MFVGDNNLWTSQKVIGNWIYVLAYQPCRLRADECFCRSKIGFRSAQPAELLIASGGIRCRLRWSRFLPACQTCVTCKFGPRAPWFRSCRGRRFGFAYVLFFTRTFYRPLLFPFLLSVTGGVREQLCINYCPVPIGIGPRAAPFQPQSLHGSHGT